MLKVISRTIRAPLTAMLMLASPFAGSAAAQEVTAKTGPWHTTIVKTDVGHEIGDPSSETLLTEFVSYTCTTCAQFSVEGDPVLEYVYISRGELRFEVRPYIRNALDLTISMLVACGDPKKFKGNHAMFLRSQNDWLPKAANAPQGQKAIWGRGDRNARFNMATSLGLTDKMTKQRGMSRPDLNTCLSDDAVAANLMANSRAAATEFDIHGTPTFAINGETLPEVHGWNALYAELTEHFKAQKGLGGEPMLGESQFNR